MQRSLTRMITIVAAGIVLIGNAMAQTAPASTTTAKPATPATAKKAPAKPGTTAAKKTPAPLALKTQKDKTSYAIGMNIGNSLHRDSLDIDPAILLRGLKDAMAGGKTLMTDDQAKAAMTALQDELRKKQGEKMQQVGEVNKKEGDAFLAANKGKDGVITLPSGLQYKILTAGTGPKPTATDSVVCNYKGTTISGTEFDSSKRGQPATFQVGQVIKGWTEALQLMPTGSKWQLFIPAELAYGARGAGADIGPNAVLIFEVELISIQGKDDKAK